MKKATIQDVADKVGVSKTTISRYLNGNFQKMSEETKRQIQKAIEELNYTPLKQAQSLKTKKSKLIGLVVSDIKNLYSSFLIKAAQDALEKTDYQLLIMNTSNQLKEEEKVITRLLNQQIDGLLLQPLSNKMEDYQELLKANIPVVLLDRQLDTPYWSSVQSDNEKTTAKMTIAFQKLGIEKLVILTEPQHLASTRRQRIAGIEKTWLKKETLEILEVTPENQAEKLKGFLKDESLQQKTMFFPLNGTLLYQLCIFLRKENYLEVENISICGYDDWFLNDLLPDKVLKLHQQPEEVAKKAVELLGKQLQTNEKIIQQVEIPTCFGRNEERKWEKF